MMCRDQCATSGKEDIATIAQNRATFPGKIWRDDQVAGLYPGVIQNRKTFYLYFRTKSRKEGVSNRRLRKPRPGPNTANDRLFKAPLAKPLFQSERKLTRPPALPMFEHITYQNMLKTERRQAWTNGYLQNIPPDG
jgi:hypothetical protein